ncbi:Ser-Thr-rich glycosyl-phosphatidyl-inositol-anchored membrane family-domain-containing protein [Hypoxylon crocopeplum]|nr:Ser-Thr-rich glycosyl-phosphatidyl-inositol-anchored membrane family-domain-containing protein [Hypoxylon crocopeplum]
MRSTTIFASALAFAASAFAQTDGFAVMTSPTEGEKIPSGQTFTIEWEAGTYTGPVTISILGGDTPSTLVPGATIASDVDITTGSFAWKVDCSLGKEKTYGIKIASVADESTFQYSFPFAISGPSCSSGAGEYPTISSSTGSSASASSTGSETGYPTSVESSSTVSSATSFTSFTSATSYPTITSESSFSSFTSVSSYTTLVPSGNLSTTAVPTTIVTSTSAAVITPSSTTPSPSTIATNAATTAGAGSLALVAGLAFAVLAI